MLDDLRDVHIALVGDDALGIVIQLGLGSLDVRLDVAHDIGGNVQLLQHLIVALENLDGIPTLLILGQIVQRGLLDMGNGVLHRAGERVHGDGLGALGSLHGGLGGLHDTVTLQSGDFNDADAQLPGQLRHIDLVAVLADNIHHVDGDDHRNTQLGELRGQVQVTLKVRAIDDVQDGIGTLGDEVVTGNDLLQRVGGQRVDARQVHDDDVVVLLQLALFLFNGNAGPVTYELVGAGQRVEKSGLAAVRVAREGNFDLLIHLTAPSGSNARTVF